MRYCLLIFFIFCYVTVFSQQEKHYAFKHFSTSNGLVSNTVHNIIQDKQGYIWFATLDGLQRYDGNRFITFRYSSTKPYSIPGDFIHRIYEDKKGNIWLWANNKVGIFHTDNFKFEEISIAGTDSTQAYSILFMGEAENGYAAIFIEQKGLYVYDANKNQFVPKGTFRFKEKEFFFSIQSINEGKDYWFGMLTGLAIYSVKTGNVNYRDHNLDSNFIIQKLQNDSAVTGYYFFYRDSLWYGSWPLARGAPFINVLDLKTGKKKSYGMTSLLGRYTETGGGLVQKSGRKWFYGRSYIGEYTGNEDFPLQFILNEFKDEQSISFDHVNYMYEDRQHNLWIGTDNGLFVFNPDIQFFNNYKLTHDLKDPGKDVPTLTVCELKNNRILLGTWAGGLYYYDNDFTPLPLPSGLEQLMSAGHSIWSIHEHSKTGLIWMGVQGNGIAVYDPVKKSFKFILNDLITPSTVRQIVEDDEGNLWIGIQNGSVVKWNYTPGGDETKNYVLIKEKDRSFINKVLYDKGTVWVGSSGWGLYKYDAQTNRLLAKYLRAPGKKNSLWSNGVNDIFRYNDSTLLIADGVLDVLNTNTDVITHFSTENGLPSNTVNSIERDNNGLLWLGMANQLCRFNFQKKISSTFDKRDGIGYDIFNPAADYKMKDGRLVYTTDRNFTVFRPESITTIAQPDNVMITYFTQDNQSLSIDSLKKLNTIDLKYNSASISIEFSTLNYIPQSKLHYYYMLEGIDKDWKLTTENNAAIYTYLPAGSYTFKVKSENTEGKQSAVTTLQVYVVPPFWQTWWFYGLIALLILAVFYWIDRERIKKLQALQKVRTQIAQNLHGDVNTTLNHINLLSEMAKIKADKEVERSKEYIEQISDKSRTMIDSMNDMLWTLDPMNDNMEKTILRMKEYAEGIQNTYPAHVQMEVDEYVKTLKPGMKVRHEIFLIFKNTLYSIATASKNSTTIINIDHHDKKILLKIQNSEVKFPEADAEQTIKQIKERAKIIDAELDIQNGSKGISLILLVSLSAN